MILKVQCVTDNVNWGHWHMAIDRKLLKYLRSSPILIPRAVNLLLVECKQLPESWAFSDNSSCQNYIIYWCQNYHTDALYNHLDKGMMGLHSVAEENMLSHILFQSQNNAQTISQIIISFDKNKTDCMVSLGRIGHVLFYHTNKLLSELQLSCWNATVYQVVMKFISAKLWPIYIFGGEGGSVKFLWAPLYTAQLA